jgi:spermidine synthase
MEIPRIKYLWSHMMPVTIEETSSEQNPYLAVALHKGRLQLLSGNAIYSWDDLYDNFTTAFGKLDIRTRAPKNALILGGGLGSIPWMLEYKFKVKNCYFTIVEYDEEVNYLANKYSYTRLKSNFQLLTADAEMFMEMNEEQYDLICVDIFSDDVIPKEFESIEFLEQCKAALEPGGLLLFNRLYRDEKDQKASDAWYDKVFKVVFAEGGKIETSGNLILYVCAK